MLVFLLLIIVIWIFAQRTFVFCCNDAACITHVVVFAVVFMALQSLYLYCCWLTADFMQWRMLLLLQYSPTGEDMLLLCGLLLLSAATINTTTAADRKSGSNKKEGNNCCLEGLHCVFRYLYFCCCCVLQIAYAFFLLLQQLSSFRCYCCYCFCGQPKWPATEAAVAAGGKC